MKDEIMQRLIAAGNVLNTIPVSGKQNLANLSGSISIIEEAITDTLRGRRPLRRKILWSR